MFLSSGSDMFKWISCKRPKICYLLLYLSILNFVLLFNNGSSLYIYKWNLPFYHYKAKCPWWIRQEAYSSRKVVSLIWPVCFGLLPGRWEVTSVKQAIVWIVKFCQKIIQKYILSKSPIFGTNTCPARASPLVRVTTFLIIPTLYNRLYEINWTTPSPPLLVLSFLKWKISILSLTRDR